MPPSWVECGRRLVIHLLASTVKEQVGFRAEATVLKNNGDSVPC